MAVICYAVLQIQVDKCLIGNADGLRLAFKVVDCAAVNVDGDLFFQRFGIRVFLGVAEIVFVEHGANLTFHNTWFLFLLPYGRKSDG